DKNINLAILPLKVLSGGQRVENFCQGLIMDVITDLSRFRSFHVISYDAVRTIPPAESLDSPKLKDLHLDYLVAGMARLQDEELLINLQLTNLPQNRLVWAEKFSGRFDNLFEIQENVVERIIATLQHFVDHDLLNEIGRKPLTELSVYECWLKGYQELKKGSVQTDEQARIYFQQAMEMDPHYPRAYTGMSLSFYNEWSCQLWSRWDISRNGAFKWAKKALELDEWDHVSNAILGRIYLYNGEHQKAEHYLRKSLQINSNDAETLIIIAFGFVYLGYPEEANALYNRARRLNPSDNFMAHACGAFVNFELGAIDESIALGEKFEIGKGWVDFSAFLAAAYFIKGNIGKANENWRIFLDEFSRKINGGRPADSRAALQWMINVNPYRHESRLKPFWDYIGKTDSEELVVDKTGADSVFENRFVREGQLWNVNFNGRQVQLPDLKGYHDLARLLARPRGSIHCTDLMGARAVETGQPLFDEKAKAAYGERILELQEQMEEAEMAQQSYRLGQLQEEYDQLIAHLSRVTGKGGKGRKVAGTVEKCRSAVTWRIRSAIRKIAEMHPELGRHLEVSVKTGIFCEYRPEHEIDWIL
ncbi:MAG: hypothetical protein P8184_20325, partial [Calditrichia bacterium]